MALHLIWYNMQRTIRKQGEDERGHLITQCTTYRKTAQKRSWRKGGSFHLVNGEAAGSILITQVVLCPNRPCDKTSARDATALSPVLEHPHGSDLLVERPEGAHNWRV